MWTIAKTNDKKYPFKISIVKGEAINLVLFSQQRWPDEDKKVFCVHADKKPDIETLEIIEEVEITATRWLENKTKLSITLDRPTQKKCEFRFVEKKYKDKPGSYTQIFFSAKPDEKVSSTWQVRETNSEKFPFQITIADKKQTALCLLTQDKWPGSSGNIFCLRAESKEDLMIGNIIEEVPVVFVKRTGKRLTVLLDRASKKRCEFLFVRKKYKTKSGDYEQIFFRTQQGIHQHRSKGNLSLQPKQIDLEVIIDSNERYPWRFGTHNTERQNLPVGDYALMVDHEIHALVERKTFDNMLSDIARIQVLHQQFTELSTYRHAAIVIEAQYGDFLSTERIGKWQSVAHMGRVFAEISVLHPNLPIIFAGNRKQANHWTLRFFEAVLKKQSDHTNNAIATAVAKTRTSQSTPLWLQVKHAIQEEMPDQFAFADLKHYLAGLTQQQIRTQLQRLKKENTLAQEGTGRNAVWRKVKQKEAVE